MALGLEQFRYLVSDVGPQEQAYFKAGNGTRVLCRCCRPSPAQVLLPSAWQEALRSQLQVKGRHRITSPLEAIVVQKIARRS